MTITQLRAELTRLGVSFAANATKAELEAILAAYTATPPPPPNPVVPSVSGLFSDAPIRLEQASFEGVEIGQVAQATLSSFRRSREGTFWIGTFAFPSGVGNVTAIVGECSQTSMTEMFAMKGHALSLRYSGSNTIPANGGQMIELPSFNVNF